MQRNRVRASADAFDGGHPGSGLDSEAARAALRQRREPLVSADSRDPADRTDPESWGAARNPPPHAPKG